MAVFACYSIKGGVGKTASAVNLSWLSARSGIPTLVWDLDPQGAATFYFRVEPGIAGSGRKLVSKKSDLAIHLRTTDWPGLDLVPADFSYRKLDVALAGLDEPRQRLRSLLAPLRDAYGHLFLDCPPSISLLSEAVFAAADVLLVPTIPTPLAVRTVAQLVRHLEKKGPRDLRILPFACLVDARKRLHRTAFAEAGDLGVPLLETAIPSSSAVEQMGVYRAPVGAFAPASPGALAYEALWAEVQRKI